MKYYSLNNPSLIADFRQAALVGQAPDKGLYFPESIPAIDKEVIRNIESLSSEEIAFRVIKPYVGDTIEASRLFDIVSETVDFPIPLVSITERIFSLELFHGPTLAFKDVGARFMSRCLAEFVKQGAVDNGRVVVLVATSGDTGGAVANGFLDVEGIDVVILFPKGKVSPVQELQLTALGHNIHALAVEGTFDDCQAMVKEAFMDLSLKQKLYLTSANSINVARWLPQQFYYFYAYKQWKDKEQPPVLSVPSGNFGNICAGLLAVAGGLPLGAFIAACNVNDTVVQFLQSGKYEPKPALPTYSNAMDVGNPSNFVRILEIFRNKLDVLRQHLMAISISDAETCDVIARVYREQGYMLDPHGAVGFLALEKYLLAHPQGKGIFLETAHPVKFPEVVEAATGRVIDIPDSIGYLMKQQSYCRTVPAQYEYVREYLLNF